MKHLFKKAVAVLALALTPVVASADLGFIQAVSSFASKQYPYHAHKQPLQRIGSAIAKYADVKGISRTLLTAVISKESSFKALARSPSGAMGLTQVVPRWHQDKIKGRNILDIENNVEVGATILKNCLDKARGNEQQALRCYCGYRGVAGVKYANMVIAEKNRFESFKMNNFKLPDNNPTVIAKDYQAMDELIAELSVKYQLKTEYDVLAVAAN